MRWSTKSLSHVKMKAKIAWSLKAGLLLAVISMLGAAVMALLVWYRHIGWEGRPSIPLYPSILLLMPIQDSVEHVPAFLGFALAVAMKSVAYGSTDSNEVKSESLCPGVLNADC